MPSTHVFPSTHQGWLVYYCIFLLGCIFPIILFCPTELVMAQRPTKQLSPCCLFQRRGHWLDLSENATYVWISLPASYKHGVTHPLLLPSFHLNINCTTLWQTSKFSFLLLCSGFGFTLVSKNRAGMFLLCLL